MYDPENINCHCLLLTVLDDNMKENSDSLEQNVAAKVINTLETSRFRSLGISLNYNQSTEWKLFSITLLSCLLRKSSKLKVPVVVYCFGEKEEFVYLDNHLRVELKSLLPIKTEPLEYNGKYLPDINNCGKAQHTSPIKYKLFLQNERS